LDVEQPERTFYKDRLDILFNTQNEPVVWRDLPTLKTSGLEQSGMRYGAWAKTLRDVVSLPIEYILPRIEVKYDDELPASMRSAEERFLERPERAHELAQMQWGYYFYLGGGLSTMDRSPNVRERNRASSIYRIAAINSILDAIAGSDKSSLSVLDFACNWGGMAVDMALRGFKDVVAFDFKEDNIFRARSLSQYMGADVRFSVEDVYHLPREFDSGFDIVLNLGLLYHVTDPVELVKTTYRLTKKIAVFDTLAHKDPFSGYIQAFISDQAIKRSGMGSQQVELHPTYRGLIDLIRFAGFKDLIEIKPVLGENFFEVEKDHYYQGNRRTIIAFK
jgi:2-polyprenyl-3-methyl-5-hydroxy-6-metoxy-1,4-benzoquinol methylase